MVRAAAPSRPMGLPPRLMHSTALCFTSASQSALTPAGPMLLALR